MNALAEEVATVKVSPNRLPDDLEKIEQRIHGLDKSALEHSLNSWGKWIEDRWDFKGYPRADSVHSFLMGGGGAGGRDRILCLDMPERIGRMHLRICSALTENEQEAVCIYYVVRMKANGTTWTIEERLETIGLEKQAFYKRLRRARLRLMGLIPR